MKIAQVFAHAVVRRVAVVLVALVLSYCGLQPAHATVPASDQGKARQMCLADRALVLAKYTNAVPNAPGRDCSVESTNRDFQCQYYQTQFSPAGIVNCGEFAGRGAGEWSYQYPLGATCAARPMEYAGLQLDNTVCAGGCAYALDPNAKKMRIDTSANSINIGQGQWKPTGATCATPTNTKPPVKNDYCSTLEGGHKLCTDTTGKKCIVSGSTGKNYCWTDSQSGPATEATRNESFSKSPNSPAPGIPATPPAPRTGEDWRPGETTSITNTTNNSTTNITNFNNAGVPSPGTGTGVPGDGSDNPGTGDGEGDGEGEGDDPGSVGEGVGTLYESDGVTLSDEFSAFWAQAQNTPLVGKINNFFGNCGYGGSCPVWSYNGGEMMGEVTFDGLCSGALEALFQYGGWIVLAMGAFCAFRIAIY